MAGSVDLALRAEAACLHGWPALKEILLDGWLLRFAEGYTRRANSVNPLGPGARELRDKITRCEASYRAQRLPTIFRISLYTEPGLDETLTALGYGPDEDETLVIYRDLASAAEVDGRDADVIELAPSTEWLAAHARFTRQAEAAQRSQRKILQALSVPAVFAGVRAGDRRFASVAFGAVRDGLVCVNLVATDPAEQRRGLAHHAVSAVLAWAQDRCGAEGACLPVVATNANALGLYRRLGFDRELYRYRYRRKAFSAARCG